MLFAPLGDSAVLIRLADEMGEAAHRLVLAAFERLKAHPPPGFVEAVPGYATVTVHYDPWRVTAGETGESPYRRTVQTLEAALTGLDEVRLPPARSVEIPVCYGEALGPDLEHVARHSGLSVEEVVRIHAAAEYTVRLLGFVPGFAYLGGLDERIATPRRATPRTEVPPSSVAIGGNQTGIYPIRCPGGWHLIGRTPERIFLPENPVPVLLRVGDRVRFRTITPDEFRAAAMFPE